MKYKRGDTVVIRADLKEGEWPVETGGSLYCNSDMAERHRGKKCVITYAGCGRYAIDIDNGYWEWSAGMFEEFDKTKCYCNILL